MVVAAERFAPQLKLSKLHHKRPQRFEGALAVGQAGVRATGHGCLRFMEQIKHDGQANDEVVVDGLTRRPVPYDFA